MHHTFIYTVEPAGTNYEIDVEIFTTSVIFSYTLFNNSGLLALIVAVYCFGIVNIVEKP